MSDPELKVPSGVQLFPLHVPLVAVCGVESQVQRTVSPTPIVSVSGVNVKPFWPTATSQVVAAAGEATARATTEAARRARTWRFLRATCAIGLRAVTIARWPGNGAR